MNKSTISTLNLADTYHPSLKQWLGLAIKAWIGAVFIGQWMFAFYILAQFTLPLVTGQLDESQFSHMIRGYVNGQTIDNTILLLHVIPVMLICMSATFQLVPSIRKRYPAFHRLNGRVFLTVGFLGAISGLYMTWGIGSRLSDLGALGVTLNGILIPIAVYYAWQFARKKQFAQHRRFAVHAFILINGVWTFRLYLMGWFMINQGPLGNNSTIDGPADMVLAFASYLLPMAIAELVFWAEKQAKPKVTLMAAMGVTFAALITFIGVVSATMMMWGPRILAAF
ncbi:DUF2306 domain-containing protein [Aliiglaciecola sp. CAU 1673]|uniref:DUF2306 domain-containing protein n=1 Tax=Aliiglaciecola sp. CAU 1673 TaxID=3032595 RepID=UPI0023DA6BDD|nr:DUF2306 domain-containing protein [Aliiglaciecola sp. CAU 1673]MDF2178172.1 DUF2306 domain-containing protein [Aliiglaciecola sp. CAU 1673]